MTPTIALAIPHTPWIPARVESFNRLLDSLGLTGDDWVSSEMGPQTARFFTDRKPNREWSMDLWRWAASVASRPVHGADGIVGHTVGATHLLQLQDDIIPAPNFWPALRAMIAAVPDKVIGLQSQHPFGRNLAHIGRRWYRSRAWLVGCQCVIPLQGPDSIHEMLKWLEAYPHVVANSIGEDVTISTWLKETGRDCWHPLPAIADVDVTLESTYAGNDAHDHRRPVVTWQGYPPGQLEDPSWWTPQPHTELVPGPGVGECNWCMLEQGRWRSAQTGACLCKGCVGKIMGHMLERA